MTSEDRFAKINLKHLSEYVSLLTEKVSDNMLEGMPADQQEMSLHMSEDMSG